MTDMRTLAPVPHSIYAAEALAATAEASLLVVAFSVAHSVQDHRP